MAEPYIPANMRYISMTNSEVLAALAELDKEKSK